MPTGVASGKEHEGPAQPKQTFVSRSIGHRSASCVDLTVPLPPPCVFYFFRMYLHCFQDIDGRVGVLDLLEAFDRVHWLALRNRILEHCISEHMVWMVSGFCCDGQFGEVFGASDLSIYSFLPSFIPSFLHYLSLLPSFALCIVTQGAWKVNGTINQGRDKKMRFSVPTCRVTEEGIQHH